MKNLGFAKPSTMLLEETGTGRRSSLLSKAEQIAIHGDTHMERQNLATLSLTMTLALCAGAAHGQAHHPADGYTATVLRLDPFPGTPDTPAATWGDALNNEGHVLGEYGLDEPTGYLWTADGGVVVLSALFDSSEPVFGSRIDDAGRIVGLYGTIDVISTIVFGYVGTVDGDFQPLSPDLDQVTSMALDIDASGRVVGQMHIEDYGGPRAVIWDGDEVVNLGTLGSNRSVATGINNAGVVIGQSSMMDFGPVRGFRWTADTGLEALDLPPEMTISDANDINDDGIIVGRVSNLGEAFAAYWTTDGEPVVLPSAYPGSNFAQARRINEHGQILGNSMTESFESAVMLWHEGEGFRVQDYVVDLPTGITLQESADLNDRGQILCHGFDSENFEFVTVLLTPISDECRVDLDGDGQLSLFDFLAFQNLFDAGDPAADFDGDGSLTIFDFLAFQNAFDAGCE
jgi:hypothetical protein